MSEAPEFPQETNPAISYIVRQASKIEDAQSCATGYYNSLKKVLSRLDKVDIDLVQSKQLNSEIKSLVSAGGSITGTINNNLDLIRVSNHKDMMVICNTVCEKVGNDLGELKYQQREQAGRLNSEQFKLIEEIRATNQSVNNYQERFKALVDQTSNYLFPPWYKVWGLRVVIFIFGVAAGKAFL